MFRIMGRRSIVHGADPDRSRRGTRLRRRDPQRRSTPGRAGLRSRDQGGQGRARRRRRNIVRRRARAVRRSPCLSSCSTPIDLRWTHVRKAGPNRRGHVSVERVVGEGERHSPRLEDRGVSTCETNRAERGDAIEAGQRGAHDLAAPRSPVDAIARSVVRHSDDGAFESVLRHDAGDMSVVMLDANLHAAPAAPAHIAWTGNPDADRAR